MIGAEQTGEPSILDPSDRDLVERSRNGDRDAFAAVYDRYGPRLFDFAYSMTRNREDAADAVADSFVRFAERLGQLRDPDALRPWLYAIARNECLRLLRSRSREAFDGEERLSVMVDDKTTPDDEAERTALRDLVWAAAAGLAERDRAMLDLHLRQGLDGAELGEAMGMSAAHAYTQLSRLRSQFERSLGALLVARTGREDCPELDRMLLDWDGTLTPLIRKRVARHLDGCEICAARRSRIVSPWALLAAVPIALAPAALRDRVLEQAWPIAAAGGAGGSGGGASGGGASTALKVSAVVAVGAAVIALIAWGISAVVATPAAAPPVAPPPVDVEVLAPGELTLVTDTLDLGEDAAGGIVTLRNDGELPIRVTVRPAADWIAVDPAVVSIPALGTADVAVAVDRSGLPPGPSSGVVEFVTKGETLAVTVQVAKPRPAAVPPRVGAPVVVRIDCVGAVRTAVIRVPVTAEAPLDSVTLTWTGGGPTSMSPGDGGWVATIGPFSAPTTVVLSATAVDDRGLSGTGPSTTAPLTTCS